MKRISLRSLLCAAGFVLLALLPRAIRSLQRQSQTQRPQEKTPGTELSKFLSLTNPHTHLPNPETTTIKMAPQLFFVPSQHSTIRIADAMDGEIIVTGPKSMIEKLEVQNFTLNPVNAGYSTYKFTKAQDGTWLQQRVSSQPASVEITREPQKVVIRFRWQPPRPEDQSVFRDALHGVDVTLTYLLDGKETRLVKRSIPVSRSEKNNVSKKYSLKSPKSAAPTAAR